MLPATYEFGSLLLENAFESEPGLERPRGLPDLGPLLRDSLEIVLVIDYPAGDFAPRIPLELIRDVGKPNWKVVGEPSAFALPR